MVGKEFSYQKVGARNVSLGGTTHTVSLHIVNPFVKGVGILLRCGRAWDRETGSLFPTVLEQCVWIDRTLGHKVGHAVNEEPTPDFPIVVVSTRQAKIGHQNGLLVVAVAQEASRRRGC